MTQISGFDESCLKVSFIYCEPKDAPLTKIKKPASELRNGLYYEKNEFIVFL